MPFIVAFFDLLKGIAWPVVVLFVASIFKEDIRSLWQEIRSLLPRLREAGLAGLKFDGAGQQKVTDEATKGSGELKEIPGFPRTALMGTLERELHDGLKIIDPATQVDLLVRLLAQARLEAAFERIYGVIFGSQILGLSELKQRETVTIEEAQNFFEPFRQKNPEFYEGYGFQGWLGFLVSQGLVIQERNSLKITDTGRDFLTFLQAKGKSLNRLG